MDQYDVSLEEQEVVQEGGRGEPPPEETKLSRLFYLQLYSSVLNAEKAHKRREKDRKRKERRSYKLKSAKRKVKSLSWMDVTNLLARSFSTEGSTRDKDIGDVEVHIWSFYSGLTLFKKFWGIRGIYLHLLVTREGWYCSILLSLSKP